LVISQITRSPGIESRRAALKVLGDVREGRAFEAALDRSIKKLAESDRRLAHELAAGVLRQRTQLDQRLAPLVQRGWDGVAAELQDILRLGAYQLTALERVPPHAAVDTSVSLARQSGGARAAGFVNAVLRRLTRSNQNVLSPSESESSRLSEEYSHPVWLVQRWLEFFGPEATIGLLRWNNTRPRLVLQPARRELDELAAEWKAAGIQVEAAPLGAGLITDRSRPAELPGYEAGDFVVQDAAQALIAAYVGVTRGAVVYDACAAPGGKTIALGRAAQAVVAGDVNLGRAERLAQNILRAGSGREYVVVADARRPPLRAVDVVLLDAPCLGTGTFGRHPDARWRVTLEALESLVRLQSELLDSLASVVLPGGLLVYSTCSLEPEENRIQVESFLARHPEFRREPDRTVPPSLLSNDGDLMILPHRDRMDGAFASRLRRAA
jgi:16S rRNA (cytosine967-C5)-methyltransferase